MNIKRVHLLSYVSGFAVAFPMAIAQAQNEPAKVEFKPEGEDIQIVIEISEEEGKKPNQYREVTLKEKKGKKEKKISDTDRWKDRKENGKQPGYTIFSDDQGDKGSNQIVLYCPEEIKPAPEDKQPRIKVGGKGKWKPDEKGWKISGKEQERIKKDLEEKLKPLKPEK